MAAPSWTPPREFDEYLLVEPLGHGSMGQVWLARDKLLERRVAIKFIALIDDSPELRARFLVEARAAARVQHPNVVAVYRVGDAFGHPYTVTELLEGSSLDRIERPLPGKRVLELGLHLARGLAAAHRRGVLHRDLKPANAFLTRTGEVKILDFGLAKLGAAEGPVERASAPVGVSSTVDPDATVRRAAPAQAPVSPVDVSAGGPVMGTPHYLAPECWRGQAATASSDVYSLGALLYELAAGRPPAVYLPAGPISEVVCAHEARPLAEVAPQLEVGLARVIERCIRRESGERYPSADELRDALEWLEPVGQRSLPEGNPYRGLLAFEAEHRSVFFGRQSEARQVLERLKSDGCVVVAGDSGAGKSSLCRAAVLPACAEGALGEAKSWIAVSLVPGRRPISSLASALAGALQTDEAALVRGLKDAPDEAPAALRKLLGSSRGLVLFVDQLEELVTASNPEEANAFARAFVALAARGPSMRVLATVRSDLLGRVAALAPGAGEAVSKSLVLLGPPGADALREVVTGPARLKGFAFDAPEVIATLAAFGERAGALPLLQFALAELWEMRDEPGRVLTRSALEKLGGVEGALARHADQCLDALGEEGALAARALLLALVTADGTRRRATLDELVGEADGARAALDSLLRGRLVVARSGPEGAGYELAHEALLSAWPRLRGWLGDDAGERLLRERLERAAAEWNRLSRSSDALYGRAQLAELERLPTFPRSTIVQSFIASSRSAERLRLLKIPAAILALLVAAAGAFGATRWQQSRALGQQVAAKIAQADAAAAQVRERQAQWRTARDEAFRIYDSGEWKKGEQQWRLARAQEAEIAEAALRANSAFEAAVLLDADRAQSKARYADWLLERALGADEASDLRARDELISRLELFDESGSRLALLNAPASIELKLAPSTARATLSRLSSKDGKSVPQNGINFRGGKVEPGSWLLEVEAPGCAPARLPMLLSRAEARTVELSLLPISAVPPGFVHIPAGAFLFGAGGDDELRRAFYEAAPLHRVETKEYLIARHELTWAEYLEYLRALPAAERRARLPSAGFERTEGGGVRITEEQGRFVLSYRVSNPAYRAREGEPLRYQGRSERAEQDWSKLPAVGISEEEFQRYAAWLRESGRVPRARLCTELEWERAARGADGRTFPMGEVLNREDANFDETYGRVEAAFGPDEVGSHPSSDSPFGLSDMAGNAFEVVAPIRAGVELSARGGSFYVGQLTVRSVNQWTITRSMRNVEAGFRVCADASR
jgi:formylglycine-generating enzyme required for sulfatase activity